MEQQDAFDSSIFSNVLEWGIIMKYGLDRGKLLHFVVFIPIWVVKKEKRRSDRSKHGSLQFLALSPVLIPYFVNKEKKKLLHSLLKTLYPSESIV